jgi:hypothetical protein
LLAVENVGVNETHLILGEHPLRGLSFFPWDAYVVRGRVALARETRGCRKVLYKVRSAR